MSPRMPFESGVLSGVMAAVLLVIFVLICLWAFSSRRKAGYEAAARLPLEDEPQGDNDYARARRRPVPGPASAGASLDGD